jgi:hypothetical protein
MANSMQVCRWGARAAACSEAWARARRKAAAPSYTPPHQAGPLKEATTEAFAHLTAAGPSGPGPAAARAALQALTALRGVGPATASAMMAVADPAGSCSYLSDESYGALRDGKPKYNEAEALEQMEEFREKAAALREETGARGCAQLRTAAPRCARSMPGCVCGAGRVPGRRACALCGPGKSVRPRRAPFPPTAGDASWTALWVERCLFLAQLEAGDCPAAKKPGKSSAGAAGAAGVAQGAKRVGGPADGEGSGGGAKAKAKKAKK